MRVHISFPFECIFNNFAIFSVECCLFFIVVSWIIESHTNTQFWVETIVTKIFFPTLGSAFINEVLHF